ncbi:FkbM family methyltransferase [Caballeronia sp. LZ008]|uniref:FkbM family methyltransferase n=1 Tax=unclassified Caballeronia TaxID=2646786 RepID=UPI0020287DAF|nr:MULTISPECIES: FkbM family methyltransferase [unclassified Caballeronia]MDR5797264.1 FkbM family methyltransferase [Caballeronia sp. LZ008]
MTTLHLSQIEAFVKSHGTATFTLAGRNITFDLSNRHERAYAATLLMNVQYPQSDLDSYLFKRFVRPGDAVLDAGANIGFTALECLDAGARKIVAAEPVPELFRRLQMVAGGEIVAIDQAISDAPGSAEIIVSVTHNQGSSLKSEITEMFPSVFGDNPRKVTVELTTIDRLVEQHGSFDVWKLDIEGAEIDALRGANRTLAERPPRVIITELYGDFMQEFYDYIAPTHPFAYRAFIRRSDYGLALVDHRTPATDEYHGNSPMYVFATDRQD